MLLSLVPWMTILEIVLAAPFTTLNSRFCNDLLVYQSLSTVTRHLDGYGTSTKIAGKDADVPSECNRPVTVEW